MVYSLLIPLFTDQILSSLKVNSFLQMIAPILKFALLLFKIKAKHLLHVIIFSHQAELKKIESISLFIQNTCISPILIG